MLKSTSVVILQEQLLTDRWNTRPDCPDPDREVISIIILSYFDPMFRSRVTRAFEHPKVRGVTVTTNFELPITRSHGAYPGARAFCRGEDPELN